MLSQEPWQWSVVVLSWVFLMTTSFMATPDPNKAVSGPTIDQFFDYKVDDPMIVTAARLSRAGRWWVRRPENAGRRSITVIWPSSDKGLPSPLKPLPVSVISWLMVSSRLILPSTPGQLPTRLMSLITTWATIYSLVIWCLHRHKWHSCAQLVPSREHLAFFGPIKDGWMKNQNTTQKKKLLHWSIIK